MTKAKSVRYPIHKQGEHCGYQEFEDGSIQPAPCYTDRMDEASDALMALQSLLDGVIAQCHKLSLPLRAQQRRVWDDIIKDYSLPKNLEYDRFTKRVSKTKPADEDEQKRDAG